MFRFCFPSCTNLPRPAPTGTVQALLCFQSCAIKGAVHEERSFGQVDEHHRLQRELRDVRPRVVATDGESLRERESRHDDLVDPNEDQPGAELPFSRADERVGGGGKEEIHAGPDEELADIDGQEELRVRRRRNPNAYREPLSRSGIPLKERSRMAISASWLGQADRNGRLKMESSGRPVKRADSTVEVEPDRQAVEARDRVLRSFGQLPFVFGGLGSARPAGMQEPSAVTCARRPRRFVRSRTQHTNTRHRRRNRPSALIRMQHRSRPRVCLPRRSCATQVSSSAIQRSALRPGMKQYSPPRLTTNCGSPVSRRRMGTCGTVKLVAAVAVRRRRADPARRACR